MAHKSCLSKHSLLFGHKNVNFSICSNINYGNVMYTFNIVHYFNKKLINQIIFLHIRTVCVARHYSLGWSDFHFLKYNIRNVFCQICSVFYRYRIEVCNCAFCSFQFFVIFGNININCVIL